MNEYRNRPVETGGRGGGLGRLQPPPDFAKVDSLSIDNDSEKKKEPKKHTPDQIPRKLLVTLLLSV